MIHEFNKKLVFPPMRWLNSVARWCLGVHSSDGSIQVTNTADPSNEGSLDLRVNTAAINTQLNAKLESLSLTKLQREQVKSLVVNLCDNFTLLTEGGLAVNQNWLKDTVNDLLTQIHSPSSETGTPTDGTDTVATVLDTEGDTWTWEKSDENENGLNLDVYCKVSPQVAGSIYSIFRRCRLTFSKAGLLVKAELLADRIRIKAANA